MLRKTLAVGAMSFVIVIGVSVDVAANADTPATEAVRTVAQNQGSAGVLRPPTKAIGGAIGASARLPIADSDAVLESVDCFFKANANMPACRETAAGSR